MKKVDSKNKTVVEHFYNLPKTVPPVTENIRSVCYVGATESISLSSSYPKEDMTFLCGLALDVLHHVHKIKQE